MTVRLEHLERLRCALAPFAGLYSGERKFCDAALKSGNGFATVVGSVQPADLREAHRAMAALGSDWFVGVKLTSVESNR